MDVTFAGMLADKQEGVAPVNDYVLAMGDDNDLGYEGTSSSTLSLFQLPKFLCGQHHTRLHNICSECMMARKGRTNGRAPEDAHCHVLGSVFMAAGFAVCVHVNALLCDLKGW